MKLSIKETLRSPSRLLTAFSHAVISFLRKEEIPPGLATASELVTWMSDPSVRLKITLIDRDLSNDHPVQYYLVKKIIDRGKNSIGLSETFVVPIDHRYFSEAILIAFFLRYAPTEDQQD